ncbi:MAG: hypothetical protein NZ108_02280, partial [Bacteroidia bacterium]|nr:hypothetical protein [Bacteroidia bacterium]
SDEYLNGFFVWQLPNHRFPSRKYSPEPSFLYNISWGGLRDSSSKHFGIIVGGPEKIYQEVGIGITHLFPEPIARKISSLRFLGIGLYYRIGAYQTENNWYPRLFYQFEF